MKHASRLAFLLLLLAGSARAQHILLSQINGRLGLVQQVVGLVPYARIDGALRSGRGSGLIFHSAPFYHNGSILVEKQAMTYQWLEADGAALNVDMTLVAYLTASQTMDNCFVAFEMLDPKGQTLNIGVVELPRLEAGNKQPMRVLLKLATVPKEGHYRVHFFSDHLECLTSLMGNDYMFGKTMAKDLAQTAARHPSVLLGVAPVYPKGLAPQAGAARISCLIGAEGEVVEASVEQAVQPEFGEAALAAVKQWIFVPGVKDHRYVAERIVVPFTFKAPNVASR